MAEGERPKVFCDGGWPIVFCEQEHAARGFTKILDAAFSDAILVMCVDAAETNGLVASEATVAEGAFGEAAIVAVIMADGDAVGVRKSFKSQFGFEDGSARVMFVKVNIVET